MSSLYELTANFRTLQMMLEDPEADPQAIADTMESVECEIEMKADGYAKIMRNMEGDISAIEKEMERLSIRKNLLASGVERLKKNLFDSMKLTGKTKFKTDLFSFGIQKNGGKAPVIMDVKDTSELPDELVRIKEEPDLDAIRKLIEKEGTCKYAHIGERGESLRIK